MEDKHEYYCNEIASGWIHNSHRNDWRWCPRYFKLRYIERERTIGSMVMEIGTNFHGFTNLFHKALKIYELEEFVRLDQLIAWLLSFLPEMAQPLLQMYIERFIVFECKRYWYYCRTLATADQEFIPVYTELDLRHRLPGERYGLAGTIDAVWRIYDGGVSIIRMREYKASRKSTRDSKFIGSVRGQLSFYKKLVDRHKLFGDPENTSFRFELYNPIMDNGVFPLETGTFKRTRKGVYTPFWFMETPLSRSSNALDESIGSFIEAMEADYYPKVKKKAIQYKCVYCNFYGLCWGKY